MLKMPAHRLEHEVLTSGMWFIMIIARLLTDFTAMNSNDMKMHAMAWFLNHKYFVGIFSKQIRAMLHN